MRLAIFEDGAQIIDRTQLQERVKDALDANQALNSNDVTYFGGLSTLLRVAYEMGRVSAFEQVSLNIGFKLHDAQEALIRKLPYEKV